MSRTSVARNGRLRRRRGRGASLRILARDFGISYARVYQILEATGGDPLQRAGGSADLALACVAELERERERLRDRIACDRRRLRAIEDEIDVRRTDRLLGLTG